jgi:sulfate permease, SulP family
MNPVSLLENKRASDPSIAVEHRSSTPFREALYRHVPAFDSLRTYSWRSLRLDVVAGLTVAAVAVPQAMAYASIAELPPQYGLYTAIIMTAAGALFDSSRQLINGPTNAISIALLSALAFVEPAGEKLPMAMLLALLMGCIQIGITLFRLGDLTRYISQAVIVGFTLGAAVLIVLDQVKHLVGLPSKGLPSEHFLTRFYLTLTEHDPWRLAPWHLPTVLIGLSTIGGVLLLRWLGTRLRVALPDLLIMLALMALSVWYFDLKQGGVHVVGDIPSHLPAFEVPHASWARIRDLSGSALAIAVLGLLEAIAMAKAIAARTGQKLDINQQCLSEGMANLTGSFFQCIPGSGSLTRSNINVQAGAVSQWSGVFSAAAVALTVILLAPYAYYIPRTSLAAILLMSAWRLVDRKQLVFHLRTTRFDAGIVIATALAAVFVSVEFCILIGVFLSFVLFVPRAAHIHLTELIVDRERVLTERSDSDVPCTRILIFDLEGELFFGSAPDLERHFETIARRVQDGIRVVVLRVKRARNPDAVCLERLGRFIDMMEGRGITVLLCGVRPDFAQVLHASGLYKRLGNDRVFLEVAGPSSSTLAAVRKAYDFLGGNICSTCPRQQEMGKDVLYYMI